MLASSQPNPSRTAHPATYHSLGQPGPTIRHVWLCLHGHDQSVTDLAALLTNLNTPERLLILPVALAPGTAPGHAASGVPGPAQWFQSGSIGPDLAQVRAFLDQLTEHILVACPPGTPLTVLGYGQGATAASAWLAGNRFPYEQLVFCAAIFPPQINRARLFADLPRAPVLVVDVTTDEGCHQTDSTDLPQDLRHARLPVRLSHVKAGPLPLAVLEGGSRPNDRHPHE